MSDTYVWHFAEGFLIISRANVNIVCCGATKQQRKLKMSKDSFIKR